MHGEMHGKVVGIGIRQACPSHDAGVVDEDVDPAEASNRRVDDGLTALNGRDVTGVGDRRSSGRCDFGDDGVGRLGVGANALNRAAEVVDDDGRPARREQKRVGASDAPPGTGDDRDPAVKTMRVQAGTGAW